MLAGLDHHLLLADDGIDVRGDDLHQVLVSAEEELVDVGDGIERLLVAAAQIDGVLLDLRCVEEPGGPLLICHGLRVCWSLRSG